jgi:UrcA family protein
MNKQMRNVMVVAAMAVTMLVGVAQAADAPERVVAFQDLNLNTAAGVQALYRRIHVAADQVCGNVDGRDLQFARVHKACVQRATADAVAAVNKPTVVIAQAR